jgi:hypothetical protein
LGSHGDFRKLFTMPNQIQDNHKDLLKVCDFVREVNHNLDELSRDYEKETALSQR